MTENHPDDAPRADDDTTRLPTDPAGASTHRYDAPADPTPYPSGSDQARVGGFAFAEGPRPEPSRRSRPGGAVIGGILAGALLVGGLSGLAGAAGYTALHDSSDEASSSSAGGATSSSVVHRQSSAAAPDSVEGVAQSVLPSVVKINVSGQQGQGSGSGIVISSDGEILTNNHVVEVAGQSGDISVSFEDGTAKRATIVGTDPLTDLAVIKAQDVSGLTPASIGVSTDVSVGENVVAIGSPFGLEATVTSGIVSAVNRPVSVGSSDSLQSGQDTTYPAIQTDAAINPGNSGGPLVDLDGDVIGINSSIRTASSGGVDAGSGGSIGLGFAIPIDQVWPVVQQLRAGDTPTHPRLGVSVTDASSDNGLLTGAGIQQVNNGEAGDDAGLQRGDVVTKVDDTVITGADSLVATIRGYRPGDKVTLTVVRNGDTRTLTATLDSDQGTPSR